jgi:hypothetical protein
MGKPGLVMRGVVPDDEAAGGGVIAGQFRNGQPAGAEGEAGMAARGGRGEFPFSCA